MTKPSFGRVGLPLWMWCLTVVFSFISGYILGLQRSNSPFATSTPSTASASTSSAPGFPAFDKTFLHLLRTHHHHHDVVNLTPPPDPPPQLRARPLSRPLVFTAEEREALLQTKVMVAPVGFVEGLLVLLGLWCGD